MFCPRARSVLFAVSVCALTIGCATETPSTSFTRHDHAQSMESALVDNHARASLISAESLSNSVTVQPVRSISREQIIEWSIRGFNDDVIIDRIDRSNTSFHLSTSEEIHLRDAGVSDEVVRAMKATAG